MKAHPPLIWFTIILLFLSIPRSGFSQDLTTGLQAYYPFNGNANDATGNGYNGTLVNNPILTTDRMGNPNSAYYLDGTSSYITIPTSGTLNQTDAMSVALFFYPTRHKVSTLVGKDDYYNDKGIQWQAAIDFSLYPGVMFGTNSAANGCTGNHLNDYYVNSNADFALDQWHCFVATFDKGVQKLYVDGALVGSVTAPFTTLNQCTNATIQIGSWWANNSQYFEGKIDELRIYDRALTPLDATAFCPTLSCPTLAGTLTGSSTCNGAPGILTFHSGSGAGPFTLTYSDGVNTYTAQNVRDSVPFAVQVQPMVSTIYTLLSIADNSGCAATTVAPGITATVNPGSCSLCTGSLGDPVISVDFGTGNGNSPPLETAVPGASSANLTYVAVNGNPAVPIPVDGQYTITNNIPANGAWFLGSPDHTPGDVNGYMLFQNADVTPGEFFRQKVSNLCAGGKYEFAAWIANAVNPAVLNGILPDLTFIVQTEDGTVLEAYNSGPVPENSVFTWRQYGFFFTLPSGVSTVVVRIVNNNPGGAVQPGNDFAIDDITFRPCGPTSTSSFSNTTVVSQLTVCEGGGGTLYGNVSSEYASPQYLWQVSGDSGRTWTDIPNSNSLQLAVTTPVKGQATGYYYRMLVADGNNIQSPTCRIASTVSILTTRIPASSDFTFSQTPCTPLQVKFLSAVQPGITYTWNIEGTDHASSPPGDLTYTFPVFGIYPVTLKTNDGVCPGSSTKQLDIRLSPADIIITRDTAVCGSIPVRLSTKPSLDFCWSPTDYLDNPASANPTATPPVTTKYYFTANIQGPNLVVNGDFSAGNTGFSSKYTYTNYGFDVALYGIGPTPAGWLPNAPPCIDHTSGTGNMMMVNGADQAGIEVWSQTVTVQPNTNYAFSAWLEDITSINPAILQFSINGQQVGAPMTANPIDCTWERFYTIWNSGNATTAVISIVNMNTILSGNDFALDDISFSPLTMLRDSVTITVNDIPVVKAGPDTAICPGQPAPLQVTGADSYSWTPAATLSGATSPTPIASPVLSTEYIVTGTTLQGCSATDTVKVDIYPLPDIRISSDTAICSGDNIRLHIEGGASYAWSPAPLLDNPASPTPLATLSTGTMFHVAIIDANGCSEKDSVKVNILTAPNFVRPLGLTVCEGSTGVLGSNNRMDYVYFWQPATGLSDPASPRPILTPTVSSQYTVNISDSTCPQYNSNFQVEVTVKPSPVVTVTKAHDIDCSQPTTQLSATGAFTYSWLPADGLSNATDPNPTVSIDTTTTYVVKGTGINGCYVYSQVTVNVKSIGNNLFIVPNAFTPNGDGHNDCYGIRRWGDVQVEEFSIFDRWGTRVFTTRNPAECWDGTFKGHPQPTGSYVYVIRAKTFCGPVVRTGNLMLIR